MVKRQVVEIDAIASMCGIAGLGAPSNEARKLHNFGSFCPEHDQYP